MRGTLGVLGMAMLVGVGLGWAGLAEALHAPTHRCPPDSVFVGPACVDTYEASVWKTTNAALIKKIRQGRATLAALTLNATPLGLAAGDLIANGCPATGDSCTDVYAVSIPGVTPAAFITQFQAMAAARNAGKRLLTNGEWQAAALGTPDPGGAPGAEDCNTASAGPDLTGARANCVSDAGVFDMVGNLWEWVADWVPVSTACVPALFAGDLNCLAGASTTYGPGALVRGGTFLDGTGAGVFAVVGDFIGGPSSAGSLLGFRCAR